MKSHLPQPRVPWFAARLAGVAITAVVALASAAVRSNDDARVFAQATVRARISPTAAAPSAAAARMGAIVLEATQAPR